MRPKSVFLIATLIVAPMSAAVAAPAGANTIAVLDLEAPKPLAELGTTFADALNAAFHANGHFTVVERRRIAEVFREQGLGQTGAVAEETAVELGNLLGARQLVVGTLAGTESGFRVDARRVDAETARVLAASSIQFGRKDAAGQAAKELAAALVGAAPPELSAAQLAGAASELAGILRARLPRVKARISRIDDLGWAVIDAGSKKGAFVGLKMVVYGKGFASGSRERRGIFLVKSVDDTSSGGPSRSETEPIRAGDTVEALPSTIRLGGPAGALEATTAALKGLPHFELVDGDRSDLSAQVSVDGTAIGARRLVLQVFDGTGGLIGEFSSSPSF